MDFHYYLSHTEAETNDCTSSHTSSTAFKSGIFNITVSNVVSDSLIKWKRVFPCQWNNKYLWIHNSKCESVCSSVSSQSFLYKHIWPVLSLTVCLFHSTWPWEESAQLYKMRSTKKHWRSETHHTPSSTKSHRSVYLSDWRNEQREKDFCQVNLLLASYNYLLSDSIFHWQCQIPPEDIPYNHLIT